MFVTKGRFDNNTFNKLMVIWIIRHSLPWARFNDDTLRINIDFLNSHAKLHSQTWAATTSQSLYLNLQKSVLDDINTAGSKISLISDVWTTKGGHKAVLGKTMDSGLNNLTMAKELSRLIQEHEGTFWDHAANHNRCFCHVLALILGAGLACLKLSTSEGPTTCKPEGFPILETITEEGDLIGDGTKSEEEEEINPDDVDLEDEEGGHNEDETETCSQKKKGKYAASGIGFTLKKVDYVCRLIASSSAKPAEFKVWAQRLGYKGPGIIGGYGMGWNVAYESRNRAYNARKIINQLLVNKTKNRKGKHFAGYEFTSKEWDNIKVLNSVLKEFLLLTKQMEADGPSCSMVLYEYSWLLETLGQLKQANTQSVLEAMFDPMIKVATKYKDLALNILKPLTPPATKESCHPLDPKDAGYNFFPTNPGLDNSEEELNRYHKTKFSLGIKGDVLMWWKSQSALFPVLSSLSRDYLACASSSAAVEQKFSASSDICTTGRSSLAPRTIEQCISSHLWIRSGVKAGGEFEDCLVVFEAAKKNPKFTSEI
ncbi:hypothetical protein PCASD_18821 [Puccinia coronata f. sp. avenae]|uniref:HAT C-terminal dimerisation domain-containing protein n=1 Tax=Puccinia coronata f. sp. avenae TaxID=200324 RepID=A0A2N5TP37_9BASI|nr:hypothetical protein PCASD_18821 [Puccinia coronata f. sp. avenae]